MTYLSSSFFVCKRIYIFKTYIMTFEFSDTKNSEESNWSFKASLVKLLLFLNLVSEVAKILE